MLPGGRISCSCWRDLARARAAPPRAVRGPRARARAPSNKPPLQEGRALGAELTDDGAAKTSERGAQRCRSGAGWAGAGWVGAGGAGGGGAGAGAGAGAGPASELRRRAGAAHSALAQRARSSRPQGLGTGSMGEMPAEGCIWRGQLLSSCPPNTALGRMATLRERSMEVREQPMPKSRWRQRNACPASHSLPQGQPRCRRSSYSIGKSTTFCAA